MALLKQFDVRDVILLSGSRSVKYFSSFTPDVCIVCGLVLACMQIRVTDLDLANLFRSGNPTEDLSLKRSF